MTPSIAVSDLPTATNEQSLGYAGWRVVAGSGAGVFFASLAFYTFSVLLKPLTQEYGWSREEVSRAFGAMTLGAALASPFIGSLFDRLGSRWICGVCLAISGSAFASLVLLTPHLWHFYAVSTLIGLATPGTSLVVYSRAIASWFDRRRGTALGVVMASAGAGAVVHPPLAETLVRMAGWRTAYVTLGFAVLVLGVPIVLRLVRERVDTVSKTGRAATGATVPEALRSRVFWTLITVVFASTLAMNGVIVHLAALMTDRGVTPTNAAVVVSVMGAASLAGRLLTGWLLDRFVATHVAFVLLSLAALGTLLLAGAGSLATGALAAALIGFGTGGEGDVVPYLVARYFGLRSLSTLYGLNWTAWGFAGAAGPTVMGRMFDTTGSYEAVLTAFALGTAAVGALTLTLPRVAGDRPHLLNTATQRDTTHPDR